MGATCAADGVVPRTHMMAAKDASNGFPIGGQGELQAPKSVLSAEVCFYLTSTASPVSGNGCLRLIAWESRDLCYRGLGRRRYEMTEYAKFDRRSCLRAQCIAPVLRPDIRCGVQELLIVGDTDAERSLWNEETPSLWSVPPKILIFPLPPTRTPPSRERLLDVDKDGVIEEKELAC